VSSAVDPGCGYPPRSVSSGNCSARAAGRPGRTRVLRGSLQMPCRLGYRRAHPARSAPSGRSVHPAFGPPCIPSKLSPSDSCHTARSRLLRPPLLRSCSSPGRAGEWQRVDRLVAGAVAMMEPGGTGRPDRSATGGELAHKRLVLIEWVDSKGEYRYFVGNAAVHTLSGGGDLLKVLREVYSNAGFTNAPPVEKWVD